MALKGSSFYVFLPSNTPVEGNKTNSFRVRLPRKLEFGSEWMVGLAVLVYPRSWPSLGTSSSQYLRIRWQTKEELLIEIPTSSFKTPLQLLNSLNDLLSKAHRGDLAERLEGYAPVIENMEKSAHEKTEREMNVILGISEDSTENVDKVKQKINENTKFDIYNDYFSYEFTSAFPDVNEQKFIAQVWITGVKNIKEWIHAYRNIRNTCKFTYDEVSQKFSISLNNNFIESVELSEQLAYIMGFDKQRLLLNQNTARFIPDMTGGVSSFNVYAPGLIEPVMVGDVTAPLLRMVNIHAGLNEEVVEENYFAIQYHKLLVKELSEIFIEIRSATGNLMPFQFGTCTLTLHFKKAPYF